MKTHIEINTESEEPIEIQNVNVGFNRAGQVVVEFETNYKYLSIHWGNTDDIELDDGQVVEAYGLRLGGKKIYMTMNGIDELIVSGASIWLIPESIEEKSAIESSCEAVLAGKWEYKIVLVPISDMQVK